MFRHHTDPKYYDPEAPSKVFVPVCNPDDLDEKQRAIVEAMPDTDTAVEAEKGDFQIDEDQIEAAHKRM